MIRPIERDLRTKPLSLPDDLPQTLPQPYPKPRHWRRLAIAGACIFLGLSATAVGLGSIAYRLSHMTVESGLVNGRTVRLQAPVDGTIQDFYAISGAPVQLGQVLVRLEPLPQDDTDLVQSQRTVATYQGELNTALQTLEFTTQQLENLTTQSQILETTSSAIAAEDINRYQAELDAAIAAEKAARSDHQRFQQLLAQGAVSQQQVEQLKADWESAQAAVRAATAERESAMATRNAVDQKAMTSVGPDNLPSQQRRLRQTIQEQVSLISNLEMKLRDEEGRLDQFQDRYGEDRALEVKAPFDGVIYSTAHDAGEQVNRPATLVSLLDCNDLWVEALVDAERANRIQADQPVRVKLANSSDTAVGEVEVIEAISQGKLTQARTEALLPAVPPELAGQPLARVRVRIPPTPEQSVSYQFCGVGQSAQLTFGMRWFGNR
ncbi:MAG: HlyD family secretion protein [Leptolyngbyaceae cyanobacterium]